ncbi:MAG: diacylglycerol kinase family protein [Planctomycetota bacterium]
MSVSEPPRRPGGFRRIDSFRFAGRGLRVLLQTQPNARIHAVITCLVVAIGCGLNISRIDWICVALASGGVWAAEALNTAIEFLTDRVSPEWSADAARIKDVAASAVLLAAIAAALTGCLVFLPPLLQVFTAP